MADEASRTERMLSSGALTGVLGRSANLQKGAGLEKAMCWLCIWVVLGGGAWRETGGLTTAKILSSLLTPETLGGCGDLAGIESVILDVAEVCVIAACGEPLKQSLQCHVSRYTSCLYLGFLYLQIGNRQQHAQ